MRFQRIDGSATGLSGNQEFPAVVSSRPQGLSGDFTREETPVPIPNTTVKLTRPMIVPTSAKVGHCRNLQ